MGAWIEIVYDTLGMTEEEVAPLVGAWIEIQGRQELYPLYVSLPSWERGLK